MLAQFLHFYPQYKLRDLRDGTVSIGEFKLLFAGMLDVVNPEATEPLKEKADRLVREAHLKAASKTRGGW